MPLVYEAAHDKHSIPRWLSLQIFDFFPILFPCSIFPQVPYLIFYYFDIIIMFFLILW